MSQAAKTKRIFDGRYEILGIVGRGSHSVVYHARHALVPSSQVALKVLVTPQKKAAEGSSLNDKLRKEALAMVSARHKFVIRIDDFHSIENLCYLSMEFAPEGDLRNFAQKRGGKLPPELAEKFLKQAAEALQFIHRAGMIHRDLKPDNILVMNENEIRIADFGVAVLPGEKFSVQELQAGVGTMDYMAPEVLQGIEYKQAADIYALGVTFYELLTGVHPFKDATMVKQIDVRKNENIPALQTFIPNISKTLADVITKAMSFEAQDRFESGRALLDALSGKKPEPAAQVTPKAIVQPPKTPAAEIQPAQNITASPAANKESRPTASEILAKGMVPPPTPGAVATKETAPSKEAPISQLIEQAEQQQETPKQVVSPQIEGSAPAKPAAAKPIAPQTTAKAQTEESPEKLSAASILKRLEALKEQQQGASSKSTAATNVPPAQTSAAQSAPRPTEAAPKVSAPQQPLVTPNVTPPPQQPKPAMHSDLTKGSQSKKEEESAKIQPTPQSRPAPGSGASRALDAAMGGAEEDSPEAIFEEQLRRLKEKSQAKKMDPASSRSKAVKSTTPINAANLAQRFNALGSKRIFIIAAVVLALYWYASTPKTVKSPLQDQLTQNTFDQGSTINTTSQGIDQTISESQPSEQSTTTSNTAASNALGFPLLPSGFYYGSINGFIGAGQNSLAMISFAEKKKIAVIVGVEGWTPQVISLDELTPGRELRVASNGIMLELIAGSGNSEVISGTFRNILHQSEGRWEVRLKQ